MKRKLLLLTVALSCAMGTWAQTDVTSTYLVNPSFEDDNMVVNLTNDNKSTAITGWVIDGINSNDGNYDGGLRATGNDTYKMSNSSGSYLLNIYGWWQGTPTAKQTISLPAGSYKLTSAVATDSDKNLRLYAGSNYVESAGSGKGSGINMEVSFTLNTPQSIEVGVVNTNWGWNLLKVDNFKLYETESAIDLCTRTAEDAYVTDFDGWEKVTSIASLQSNPENYYFAIFSADATLLLYVNESDSKLYYKTLANPMSNNSYLFEIENYGTNGGFVLKSTSLGNYFANSEGNPWNYQATKTSVDDDCEVSLILADGSFSIRDKHENGAGNNYLGLWTPENGYKNDEVLAGNKSNAAKGSFLIYRIAKDNKSYKLSNSKDNWTGVGEQSDEAAHNGGVETYHGNKKEFETGNVLTQTISGLSNGNYVIQFYAFENFADWESYSCTTGDCIAQVFANSTTKNINTIKSKTNDEWVAKNLHTLHFLVTNGSLTYGIKNIAKGGNWAACKAVSLTYLGEELEENLDLTGLILNPTFENVGSASENTGWIGSGRSVESKEDWTGTSRNVMAQNGNGYNRKQSITFPYAGTYRLDVYGLTKENGEFGAKIADSDGTNVLTLSTQVYNASTRHYTVGTDGIETSTLNSDGSKWTIEHIYFDIPANTTTKYIHLHSNYSEPNYLAYIGAVKLTYMGETADNNNFFSGAVTDGAKIATYPHDAGENDVYGAQYVPGWTATNNVQSIASGVINVNTETKLGGSGVPSEGYINSNDKLLGLLAVWSGTVQYRKNITLAAGTYSLCIPIYNVAGSTDFSKNLFGFVESNGTEHYATATTYSVGEWTLEKVTFNLASKATGYISLGYTAVSAGDASMPHLFVDRVMLAPAIDLNENTSYTPEAGYANVTLTRSFDTSKWATFVVPFDIDEATLKDQFGDGVKVCTISASDKTGVSFSDVMANPSITANTPVIMKVAKKDDYNRYTFNAVEIKVGSTTTNLTTGVDIVANYSGEITIPSESGYSYYYVKSNNLYKSTGTQKTKGFRAYFKVANDVTPTVKAFFDNGFNFDGTDAVKSVEAVQDENAVIYNLAGQRVGKAQKGLYIVNGKKVMVK